MISLAEKGSYVHAAGKECRRAINRFSRPACTCRRAARTCRQAARTCRRAARTCSHAQTGCSHVRARDADVHTGC